MGQRHQGVVASLSSCHVAGQHPPRLQLRQCVGGALRAIEHAQGRHAVLVGAVHLARSVAPIQHHQRPGQVGPAASRPSGPRRPGGALPAAGSMRGGSGRDAFHAGWPAQALAWLLRRRLPPKVRAGASHSSFSTVLGSLGSPCTGPTGGVAHGPPAVARAALVRTPGERAAGCVISPGATAVAAAQALHARGDHPAASGHPSWALTVAEQATVCHGPARQAGQEADEGPELQLPPAPGCGPLPGAAPRAAPSVGDS
mmetsp:Transcript_96745/g.307006  ORF Transcript_96745/g.307006 Transcript_96745/m.307006 type:complete len:257 (-) Transcript_96745:565-1335(-)